MIIAIINCPMKLIDQIFQNGNLVQPHKARLPYLN